MKFDSVKSVKSSVTTFLTSLKSQVNYDVKAIIKKFTAYKTNTMTVDEFEDLLILICVEMSVMDNIYDRLAVCILFHTIDRNNKTRNLSTFSDRTNYINEQLPNYMSPLYVEFVNENSERLNAMSNNYNSIPDFLTYHGVSTLLSSYCISVDKQCVENPLDTFLRCSIGINYKSEYSLDKKLESIDRNINYIHMGKFIHATPTLFNAGTNNDQLSSCYILGMEDSIVGIYKTLSDCAKISQKCGGIGFPVTNVRASGAKIHSSNGESSGLIPMLRVYNNTAVYVNQGGRGSKRKGAFAAFLEPWHADIREFIEGRLQHGAEEKRTRDLNLGLWIPDLFMKQLEIDGDWYLMCPAECPGLVDAYGNEFETLYWKYVAEEKYREKIKANDLIPYIKATISSGGQPYMMFKDTVNKKSNQSNIGTVKSSNLCCEVTEVSNFNQHAVCNLASICVNRFLNADRTYNYEELRSVAYHITHNLNKVIDINQYPTEEAKNTNNATRPIGIGIQGVADLLMSMRIPYDSPSSLEIEARIMETIYYGSMQATIQLAMEHGQPYDYFENSNFARGLYQFDMGYNIDNESLMWDWNTLKEEGKKHGMYNSLLTALMPTASTSQIMGNCECFEPITSNMYIRQTSSGQFKCINKFLVNDLKEAKLWNKEMKDKIIAKKGSVQDIPEIPPHIKAIYKTVWEIKQKWLMDHAIARSPFVDQSQSMNLHFPVIEEGKLRSAMFYAWKKGLKTGSYYIRSQASKDSTNVAVDTKVDSKAQACSRENRDECTSCSA